MHCPIACDQCDLTCEDYNTYCEEWARVGECYNNREYMGIYCRKVSVDVFSIMNKKGEC